jgi:hypothetical protein
MKFMPEGSMERGMGFSDRINRRRLFRNAGIEVCGKMGPLAQVHYFINPELVWACAKDSGAKIASINGQNSHMTHTHCIQQHTLFQSRCNSTLSHVTKHHASGAPVF